jgi:hypothetical protein
MVPGSIQPSLSSTSHSLKRNVRSRGGQRWKFKLSFKNRTRDELMPLIGFALANRGQYGTFDFVPAVVGQRQATGGGSPVVSAAIAAGRSVPVSGVTANATLGKVGDFVKFNGHSKVYMLTANAVANGSGAVTLSIEPALYVAVALNESVILNGVPFRCYFAQDVHEFPMMPGVIYDWECELIEELP